MKMVMAVVSKEKAKDVVNEVIAAGYTATSVESRGGMLRQHYETLFIAVEDEDLEEVLAAVGQSCHTCVSVERRGAASPGSARPALDTAEVGGAIVFVWDLQGFFRY